MTKHKAPTRNKSGTPLLPGGGGGRGRTITNLSNFQKAKRKMEETGKLDLEYFNNAKEVGMFIDWYNQGVKDRHEKYANNEITEISKLVARIMGRKTIVLGGKK